MPQAITPLLHNKNSAERNKIKSTTPFSAHFFTFVFFLIGTAFIIFGAVTDILGAMLAVMGVSISVLMSSLYALWHTAYVTLNTSDILSFSKRLDVLITLAIASISMLASVTFFVLSAVTLAFFPTPTNQTPLFEFIANLLTLIPPAAMITVAVTFTAIVMLLHAMHIIDPGKFVTYLKSRKTTAAFFIAGFTFSFLTFVLGMGLLFTQGPSLFAGICIGGGCLSVIFIAAFDCFIVQPYKFLMNQHAASTAHIRPFAGNLPMIPVTPRGVSFGKRREDVVRFKGVGNDAQENNDDDFCRSSSDDGIGVALTPRHQPPIAPDTGRAIRDQGALAEVARHNPPLPAIEPAAVSAVAL